MWGQGSVADCQGRQAMKTGVGSGDVSHCSMQAERDRGFRPVIARVDRGERHPSAPVCRSVGAMGFAPRNVQLEVA